MPRLGVWSQDGVRREPWLDVRGRVGRWGWDLPPEPSVYRQSTDAAIGHLQHQLEAHRSHANGRISAWSILVGHTTCSDPLWRAAKELSDEHGVGLSFHMSPAMLDPEGFIAEFGQRPMVHLAELGVLGPTTAMTHLAVQESLDGKVVEWLEHVTDEQYQTRQHNE